MSETAATDAVGLNGAAGPTEHSLKPTADVPEAVDANEADAGEEEDEYDFEVRFTV
jgi:hypothetical protein